jgi:hypothetical protein
MLMLGISPVINMGMKISEDSWILTANCAMVETGLA